MYHCARMDANRTRLLKLDCEQFRFGTYVMRMYITPTEDSRKELSLNLIIFSFFYYSSPLSHFLCADKHGSAVISSNCVDTLLQQ